MRHSDLLAGLALLVLLGAVTAALHPAQPRPAEPEPQPGDPYPACPLCGGGPVVHIGSGVHACRSCARAVRRTP